MTREERAILEFEETHPGAGMAKASAVRAVLGMTGARYEQRIQRLIVRRDVIEEFPMVANRRARLAEMRRRKRATRAL